MGFASLDPSYDFQTHFRVLAAEYRPSFAASCHPLCVRGCREDRVPAGHPRSTVRRLRYKRLHSGIQVKPSNRPSLRSGLTAYAELSPGSVALLPPSPCRYLTRAPGWAATSPQDLTPACGRQDHTVLPYATHTGRIREVFCSRLSALQNPSRRCN